MRTHEHLWTCFYEHLCSYFRVFFAYARAYTRIHVRAPASICAHGGYYAFMYVVLSNSSYLKYATPNTDIKLDYLVAK